MMTGGLQLLGVRLWPGWRVYDLAALEADVASLSMLSSLRGDSSIVSPLRTLLRHAVFCVVLECSDQGGEREIATDTRRMPHA
jgi:hypothetical protein